MLIIGVIVMVISILVMIGIPVMTLIEDHREYKNGKYDDWRDKK